MGWHSRSEFDYLVGVFLFATYRMRSLDVFDFLRVSYRKRFWVGDYKDGSRYCTLHDEKEIRLYSKKFLALIRQWAVYV